MQTGTRDPTVAENTQNGEGGDPNNPPGTAAGAQHDAAAAASGGAARAAAGATSPPAGSMGPPPTRAPWALSGTSSLSSASSSGGGARSVSPATGSHFPQLARPLPGGAAITGNTHDTMSPTAAPWAVGAIPPGPPGGVGGAAPGLGGSLGGGGGGGALRRPGGGGGSMLTGKPVAPLVEAEPHMPATRVSEAGAVPVFEAAGKRIGSEEDLRRFLDSAAAKDFVAFILSLNQAATGTKLSAPCTLSPPLTALVAALDSLRSWVDEIPPTQQSLRYGNPAYRTWFARMAAAAPDFLRAVLPERLAGAVVELAPYFVDSFGNATRIDYGTGHETTFVALLYCLAALGVVGDADRAALVNVVFDRYLKLMRHIQTTYWLEPAGSHGVWGLDDYQFLPFVWGSAQLISHPVIRPGSIHNPDILEAYAKDYLYLGAVAFVKQVKKGPLFETSPMLNDVSGIPAWSKVNAGMIKMYQAEVLGKFPIMQHFLFGSLLRWE